MKNKIRLNEYSNGQIPDSDLGSLVTATGGSSVARLNKEAAKDFNAMVKAAYDESKLQIALSGPNSGYRPLGSKEEGCTKSFTQWCAWQKYKAGTGNLAAKPGNSNHGLGAAVDVANCKKGGPIHTWLTKNAKRFNFYPLASEPWHWDHTSGKRSRGRGGGDDGTDPSDTTPSNEPVNKSKTNFFDDDYSNEIDVTGLSSMERRFNMDNSAIKQAVSSKLNLGDITTAMGQNLKEEIDRIKQLLK